MSTMREIQMCTFEVLKEVVRICDKHQLTYYLDYGTLLGAIRHKGFIPWDNDIDIEMPIKDYRKFLKIAPKEISENFFIQTYKSDHGYNLLWTQVRANNTTSLPIKYKDWDIHWGMHIDIFPLVGISEEKIGEKLQTKGLELARALINKEYLQACEPDEIATNKKLKMLYVLPRALRVFVCDLILRMALKDPSKFDVCSGLDRELSYRIDTVAYKNTISVEFEGMQFAAPEEYDYVLTTVYGDYMTPPPENERYFGHEGSHGKIIYDHTTDYKVYKEQLRNNKPTSDNT